MELELSTLGLLLKSRATDGVQDGGTGDLSVSHILNILAIMARTG